MIARVDRALACGAAPDATGALWLLRAQAHIWRAEFEEAERWALDALRALPLGSERWFDAIESASAAAARLGHTERFEEFVEVIEASWSDEWVSPAQMIAAVHVAVNSFSFGAYDRSIALFERIEAAMDRFSGDPVITAHVSHGRAFITLHEGDMSGSQKYFETAARSFEEVGDTRQALLNRLNAALGIDELGAYSEAARLYRDLLADMVRMGLRHLATGTKIALGVALGRLGAVGDAIRLVSEGVEGSEASNDVRSRGGAHKALAGLLLDTGNLENAEAEARIAIEVLAVSPPLRPHALAILSAIELARGCAEDALATASRAMKEMTSLGQVEEGEAIIRLTYARALFATGNLAAARSAISDARDHLLRRASKITDPAWRMSFLENVPENAGTLELASAWLS